MDEHDTVERALADLRAGQAVLVLDDADREGEGDLVFAAQHASAELVAFTVRHTSGFLCVAMADVDADRLGLPPMTHRNEDRHGTAYCVTVDARVGVSTGISASDRAHTLRLLADPAAGAADLTRPGHVVPLRARPGGVLARRGHTEAAVDLTTLAGLHGVGALCEVVSPLDPTRMAKEPELLDFAAEHGLTVITVADVVAYRRRTERLVVRAATAGIPTAYGHFTAVAYRSSLDGVEHLALVTGDLGDGRDVLVRIHSECLTGDVIGSLRCDCGKQFEAGLDAVSAAGRGVVLYLRGHEGRGIGLVQKLRAYQLQEAGADTVDANLALGEPADARDYLVAAHMLADLGVSSVRLLSNNPDKRAALEQCGITVAENVAMRSFTNPQNLRYLRTKRDRMGHDLPQLEPYRDFGALWAEPAEPIHLAGGGGPTVRTA